MFIAFAAASCLASGSGEAMPDVEAADGEPLEKRAFKVDGGEKDDEPLLTSCDSLPVILGSCLGVEELL